MDVKDVALVNVISSSSALCTRMMAEIGGDFIMNAAIFLRSRKPCCHLKAGGFVKCKSNYTAMMTYTLLEV